MEPRKILVADDDPEIREVLRLLLTGEGAGTEVIMEVPINE